jgi:nicotinamidase/pyrazinamidase
MKALLLIDIQNDFLPTGALPVPQGDQVMPVANRLMEQFDLIVATQDWHPANHGSFAANHAGRKPGEVIELEGLQQILWPVHCVQNTPGADFAPGLDRSRIAQVVRKGTDPAIDSYSGYFDNGHRKATGLDQYLRSRNVTDLTIVGLATDYCVKFTALDAQQLGYRVHLIPEGCRGVNLKPGDVAAALREMTTAGVKILPADQVAAPMPGAPR